MEIKILHLLEGAKAAKGLTVIIDVFRAFSTACYAFNNGVSTIYPVGNIADAYSLKKNNSEYILMGERDEKKPEGFNFGNSPSQILYENFSGKTIVHTTSSGTQGIANAQNADEIITGSFVNAKAITKYILHRNPKQVSLVCMGYACEYPTDEDTLCAEYIKNELEGITSDFEKMKQTIRNGSGSRFFIKENQTWAPAEDYYLCLDLNKFDFILKIVNDNGLNFLTKIDMF